MIIGIGIAIGIIIAIAIAIAPRRATPLPPTGEATAEEERDDGPPYGTTRHLRGIGRDTKFFSGDLTHGEGPFLIHRTLYRRTPRGIRRVREGGDL